MERKFSKREKGQVVLFVLFVVLFMFMFVALFIAQIINNQVKIINNSTNSMQAYYYADGCAENVTYWVQKGSWKERTDASGKFNLEIYNDGVKCTTNLQDEGGLKLTVVGKYKNISSRALRLGW